MRGSGSIYQRKDGIWTTAVSLGFVDGKRVRETFYGPSEDAVKAKLANAQMLLGSGTGLPSKVTLGAWLDSWIGRRRVQGDIAPRTAAGYQTIIDTMPAWLLAVPLGRLNGGHVQTWVDGLGGSPRTVAWKRNTLRAALNEAMRRGLVDRNAAALARPPKQRRPKRVVLTAADCGAILAALGPYTRRQGSKDVEVAGWRYQAAAAVAIGCGLRMGELLGLSWAQVSDDRLVVLASLSRVDGEYVRTATKTEASDAVVPIPAFVRPYLAAWDALQAAEWAAAHPGLVDIGHRKAGPVFTTATGSHVNGSMVTQKFQARLARAGLPRIRFHDLRHATADLLADVGVSQTVARDFMRHSSYATTADHYTATAWAGLRRAADALDRAMGE